MTKSPLQEQLPCETENLDDLMRELLGIRSELLRREASYKHLDKVHPGHQKSARNLLHYLAFRLHDVRNLQINLSEWGLSSLGRAERKVQAAIDTVLHIMHQISGKEWNPKETPPACFREGRRMLEENTAALLGDYPSGRRVRIMVTMPSEAADNFRLVNDLLESGMNCARINCAHDSPEVWGRMVANIRRAESAVGRRCKIQMDLGGPKLRTGALELRPQVIKFRPQRNEMGEVTSPAMIQLFAEETIGERRGGLPVPGEWLKQVEAGDRIVFDDARGAARRLKVETVDETGVWASTRKTVYITPGINLLLKTKKRKVKNQTARITAKLPRHENTIRLNKGELLIVTRNMAPGRDALRDAKGVQLSPGFIGCTLPEVLNDVRVGESIWFDDGKIGGIIEKVEPEQIIVRISHASPTGERLRSEKGINLPDTELHLPAITREDLQDLKFVVEHADMIGLSFANTPADVEDLIRNIRKYKKDNPPGIVLKVETKRGFDNLPAMILAAMQTRVCGVMIARGDLAIECGFGRLAEVQEQILWICEAAHVPAIWATQVLEELAKQGLPTRAEVTDAAMGQRAECIMLNKGEHIVGATKALDDILRRMQDHQTKKRSLLRKLHLAEKFFSSNQ
jgi:pyruvate kinase